MKKDKIIAIIQLIFGIAIIFTVLWGYVFDGEASYMYELTCISNLAAGLLLILDAIFYKNHKLSFLYLLILPCILTVFFVTFICSVSGLGSFNWSGAFLFMHGINPWIVLIFFAITYPLLDKKKNIISIFTAPSFLLVYLQFDLIRYYVTGELIYGLLEPENMVAWVIILFAIGAYILEALLAYGLISLRKGVICLEKKHSAKTNNPQK